MPPLWRQLAVEVGEALPHADRGEMLRLQARHLPLVDGVVGDAAAGRPCRSTTAARRPIRCSRRSPWSRAATSVRRSRANGRSRVNRRARRRSRPAPISPDRTLPSSGTCWSSRAVTSGCFCAMRFPGGLVAVLEMQPLAVRAVAEDHRIAALLRSGRKTSQRSTSPSSIVIGMSQSMRMPSRTSLTSR